VDLSAILDRGDAPKGPDTTDRHSTVPARPLRPSSTTRRQPGESAAPRARGSDPSASGEHLAGDRIRIVNLSLGGACIEAAEPLAPGADLELEIVAPTLWDPLVLKGRVVWSRTEKGSPHRAGLWFETGDPSRAFALFELLGAHDYD
jgi:PilZ domain